jgi:NAD+ kinase
MKEKFLIVYDKNIKSKNVFRKLSIELERRKIEFDSIAFSGLTKEAMDNRDISLFICIGGDGLFLKSLNYFNFPNIKIAGINTGHLGFFQEFGKNNIDEFLDKYEKKDYIKNKYYPIEAKILADKKTKLKCLNEITVKGSHAHAIELDLYIGKSMIEKFYGDGLIVSTSAGSTAYNYAIGGSIIDHRLNILQLAPIAPIKSAVFSSFTSSIVLPATEKLKILPIYSKPKEILIAADGISHDLKNIKNIEIKLSKTPITLLRFSDYDFWDKAKKKLL